MRLTRQNQDRALLALLLLANTAACYTSLPLGLLGALATTTTLLWINLT